MVNPKVKDILSIIGLGLVIPASVLMPALPMAIGAVLKYQKQKEYRKQLSELSKYDQNRLRYNLKRLLSQRYIEVSEKDGLINLNLTEKGRLKTLRYKLEELVINKTPAWDGKWRLVIYDIPKEKRLLAEIFRNFLRKMECLKLQKSVYLTPYKCDEQIEFLRSYYNIGENVLYLVVQRIENEEVYKRYFGIN